MAAFLAIATYASAQAQSGEKYWAGKQVRLIIGSAEGGGYDLIGRTVAQHMGHYLPGQPRIIP
jgi:tripartite-type tricarboxylate transporter receptor subunit TctC